MDFDLQNSLEILSRTPGSLRSMLSGISSAWLRGTEGPDSWSSYDIVGHLIHGEKTDWIPRAKMILEHGDTRAFEPFDRFFMKRLPQDVPLEEMLREFESLRKQNLDELQRLITSNDQLEKKGKHPELGDVTMKQLLATWVVHDLGHLSQINRVLAKQYTDAVGPWRGYLPVLDTRLR